MIKSVDSSVYKETALLHQDGMPNDFLPSFGTRFLQILHQQLLSSPQVISIGYFEKDQLIGFVVGTTNTKQVMRHVFIQGAFKFIPFIVLQIFKSPRTLKFLWQTLFYGDGVSLPAELIIISVKTGNRHKGIGTKLMKTLKAEFKKRRVTHFKVGTLSTNKPANQFYLRSGGIYKSSFSIYDRLWNVYHFSLK